MKIITALILCLFCCLFAGCAAVESDSNQNVENASAAIEDTYDTSANENIVEDMWSSVASSIENDISNQLQDLEIVKSIEATYESNQINIEIEIANKYISDGIKKIFNSLADYDYELYHYINRWTDSHQGVQKMDDQQVYKIDTNLIISTEDKEIQYQLAYTINNRMTEERGIEYVWPEWIAIKWPPGEEPFSFLYVDNENITTEIETVEPAYLNNIAVFSTTDITKFKNALGYTIGDSIATVLNLYEPEDVVVFGSNNICMFFNFGYITFHYPVFSVDGIFIEDSAIVCPRETRVGDNYEDVQNKYPIGEIETYDSEESFYTLHNSDDWLYEASKYYDEEGNIADIEYYASSNGYDPLYVLRYSIQNGEVDSIDIFLTDQIYFSP